MITTNPVTTSPARTPQRRSPSDLPVTPAPKPGADPWANLTGPQRDAAEALTNLFAGYGLGSLAAKIVQMVQSGMSSDTITIELQQTDEYKKRFAANAARVKNGLVALDPKSYLAVEGAYRQYMRSAGLPVGYYDQPQDFQKWIENDVSPDEVRSRVDAVTEALNTTPPQTLEYFKRWYSTGDIVAYALDSARALPLIQQRIKAAEAGGIAAAQGVNLGQAMAEQIGQLGSGASVAQLQQGLGFVAQEMPTVTKLGSIYGGATTADEVASEVFLNNAAASEKRKKLASKERAAFSGSGGQSKNTLSRTDSGSI